MIFGSVFSGIEAASVAWHPLGWRAAFVSEIAKFPSAVLAHHYPTVPNHGDILGYESWPDHRLDVLCGGPPCQSDSVAGKRGGMADPRGALKETYLRVVERYRPTWVLFEGVPGVLSVDEGRAFGALVGGLGELGYLGAWSSLDAQYRGLAQRRERVFFVGCARGWQCAAAVLFDAASMRGDPAPSRETRESVAGTLAASSSRRSAPEGDRDHLIAETLRQHPRPGSNSLGALTVAHALRASGFDASEDGTGRGTPLVPVLSGAVCAREGKGANSGVDQGTPLLVMPFDETQITSQTNRSKPAYGAPALARGARPPSIAYDIQAGALRENPNSGPNGIGVKADLAYTIEARAEVQAVAFSCKDSGNDAGELSPTLRSMNHDQSHANAGGQVAVAFMASDYKTGAFEQADTLRPLTTSADRSRAAPLVASAAVRRLTPRECERLQGFPDDYTLIPYRGKPAADGPRYHALGNSWAVPVVQWIGERIQAVESLVREAA